MREDLYEQIEAVIRPREELPKSVSDFVNQAVREKLERLNKEGGKP
ncbi:MAG: hypothetical protein H5T92_00315 [Synergistales bacterium]|nr:hypothetical protein [Synergistales bacterium]